MEKLLYYGHIHKQKTPTWCRLNFMNQNINTA